MPDLEISLWLLTIAGLVLGSVGILWVRTSPLPGKNFWGRLLFVFTLLTLGGSSLVAAFHLAQGLVPLGLAAGLLLVVMLWEVPTGAGHSSPLPDET